MSSRSSVLSVSRCPRAALAAGLTFLLTGAAGCLPRNQAGGAPLALGPDADAPAVAEVDVDVPIGAELTPGGSYGLLADGSVDPMPMPAFPPLYFGFDQFTLSPESRATLDDLASYLRQHPAATVTVGGHCDERGTAEYNLALGERRAQAAHRYLAQQGVPAERVRVVSYGSERPALIGQGEGIWAQNRRDELQVADASVPAVPAP